MLLHWINLATGKKLKTFANHLTGHGLITYLTGKFTVFLSRIKITMQRHLDAINIFYSRFQQLRLTRH